MEFTEVIRQRRAVRDYTSQSVDRDTIERLVATAIWAPSAENRQPWGFAALLDPQRIDECAEHAKRWLLQHPEALTLDPALQYTLANPQFSIFYHAPALVMVLAKSADPQAKEDSCLAAENFLLAARDIGLGTCWIGLARPWLDLPQIKADLGIPTHYDVVAPIVVGQPRKWPQSQGRSFPAIHWLR